MCTDSPTDRLLTEVFEYISRNRLNPGSYTDNGTRAKQLAADIGFWRVHAQDRGIDVALAVTFKISQSSFGNDFSFDVNKAFPEIDGLTKLFTWLLCPKTNIHSTLDLLVTNIAVYQVAELLIEGGMRIKLDRAWPLIEDGTALKLSVCARFENIPSIHLATVHSSAESATATDSGASFACLMDQHPNESIKEQDVRKISSPQSAASLQNPLD